MRFCRSTDIRAMTLLELVVTLGLLAALATLAVSSLDGLDSRSRMDTTERRLDMIERAVVGDKTRTGRFFEDMGRYPVVQEIAEGRLLSELWTEPTDAGTDIGYREEYLNGGSIWSVDSSRSFYSELPSSVTLFCGWNGPYLDNGHDELYDGFGNEFLLSQEASPDPTEPADWWGSTDAGVQAGDDIRGVISYGADQAVGGTEWMDGDTYMVLAGSECSLVLSIKALDRSALPNVWRTIADTSDLVLPTAWAASTAKAVGDRVTNAAKTKLFECRVAGTTGVSEPSAFGTVTFPGQTVTETGGVQWTYLGPTSNLYGGYLSHLRVTLFVPHVTQTTRQIETELLELTGADGQVTISDVNGRNLLPGHRKIYAYGFYYDGSSEVWALSSGTEAELIELRPGVNCHTVYLSHVLK